MPFSTTIYANSPYLGTVLWKAAPKQRTEFIIASYFIREAWKNYGSTFFNMYFNP